MANDDAKLRRIRILISQQNGFEMFKCSTLVKIVLFSLNKLSQLFYDSVNI
jgi:hypothetical protein